MQFNGRHDPGYSETDDTAPMIREDLPLTFDASTRSYHFLPPGMPDTLEIAEIIRRTEVLLASPDAHAIRRAGLGHEIDRLLRLLSTHAALAVTAAIKTAFYGEPS